MNAVFKAGDVVFHPVYGEGVVQPRYSGMNTVVRFDASKQEWECDDRLLSFFPWPAPNHVRPFKPGWWLRWTGTEFDVRWRIDDKHYKIHTKKGTNFTHESNGSIEWIKPMGHNPEAPEF